MTLSTLQRELRQRIWKKTALVYGVLSAFCGLFSVVYLQFSHGESSAFLVWLFAPALLLGALPAWLLSRATPALRPGKAVRRLWNSAVAMLSAGMLVRAIINIAGRYTDYDTIYWIVSGALFITAIAVYIRQRAQRRPALPASVNRLEAI